MATEAQRRRIIRKHEAEEKRLKALSLRRGGATYEEIATLAGYNSRQAAHSAITSYLKRETHEEADEYRKLQLERYELLLKALASKVKNGDAQSINAAVKVLARIDALLGLEMPRKVDVTSKGEKIQAYDYGNAIAAIAARPDEDSDAPGEDKSNRDGQTVGKDHHGG